MTWSTVLPILTTSPTASVRGASIRSSLTKVPLADPRSSIVSSPSSPRETHAWRREISGSSPSLPSCSGATRPISRSVATLRRLPRSLPSLTRSCSPAIHPGDPTRLPGSARRRRRETEVRAPARPAEPRVDNRRRVREAPRRRPGHLELQARVEAERAGRPFLLYRNGDDCQQLFVFAPGSAMSVSVGRAGSGGSPARLGRCRSRAFTPGSSGSRTTGTLVDDGLSRNGTFVNDERLSGRRRLKDGDTLRFGATTITFRSPQPRAAGYAGPTGPRPR